MSKPTSRLLKVIRKEYVTANMLRVTLGGEALAGFPEDQEGGYIKFIFPTTDGSRLMRTYTIRQQRQHELDVDFALHGTLVWHVSGHYIRKQETRFKWVALGPKNVFQNLQTG